jgi:hypothetical protein
VWHAIKDDNGLQAQVLEIRKGLLGDPLHPEVLGMCARVESHLTEHARIEKELAAHAKRQATIVAGIATTLGGAAVWVAENIQGILAWFKKP